MINIINRTKQGSNVSSEDSNIFRWWSPEFIIKQFDYIAEQGVKNVKIADELFVLNPRHFEAICDLIIERGYDFNIWAYSRVDTCKPKHLDKLAKAGVNWLGLGIENPNNELRKEIHKEGFQEVRILDLFKVIREAGIALPDTYSGYSQHSYDTLNLASENLTAAQILSFRDYAWDIYHSNENYLNMVKTKFGDKAVNELNETRKIKLKRKLLET